MLSRIGSFRASSRATGEGSISGAALMLAAESQGLAIDFTDRSMVIKDTGTPDNVFSGNPNAKLTYSSPSTKWILNRNGVYESGTTLRTEYDASGVALGVRIEEARVNVFLNSRSPATQNISVSATPYTLSFLGTGTMTLSGASTAGPLVGTGTNNRVALTFTPSAGTLTCTVSGTMDFVQLEAGSFATSPIVTDGSSVTRAADDISIAASSFPSTATAGTAYVVATRGTTVTGNLICFDDTTANEKHQIYYSGGYVGVTTDGGVSQAVLAAFGTDTAGATSKIVYAWQVNNIAGVRNGGTVYTDASATMPTTTRVVIGSTASGQVALNSHLKAVMILPRRMSNAEAQAVSA